MCPAMRSRWIFTLPMMALLLPAVSLRAQNQSSQGHAQGTGNDQHGNDPNDEELAKEVQNPLADLIQVQVGNDFGFGGGTGNRLQYLMTLQPVIPIKLSNDWNLITRSTFNVVSMPDFDSETARIYRCERPGDGVLFLTAPINLSGLGFRPRSRSSYRFRALLGDGQVVSWTWIRCHQADRALDVRLGGQSCLVVCRQSEPRKCQFYVHTTSSLLYVGKWLDIGRGYRNNL